MLFPDAASYVWQVSLLATHAIPRHWGALSWLAFYAMVKTMTKSKLGKRKFISPYSFQSIQGNQGRNLKVETEAEAMEGTAY